MFYFIPFAYSGRWGVKNIQNNLHNYVLFCTFAEKKLLWQQLTGKEKQMNTRLK